MPRLGKTILSLRPRDKTSMTGSPFRHAAPSHPPGRRATHLCHEVRVLNHHSVAGFDMPRPCGRAVHGVSGPTPVFLTAGPQDPGIARFPELLRKMQPYLRFCIFLSPRFSVSFFRQSLSEKCVLLTTTCLAEPAVDCRSRGQRFRRPPGCPRRSNVRRPVGYCRNRAGTHGSW